MPTQIGGGGRLLLVESTATGLVKGLDLSAAPSMQWPYVVDRVTGRVGMPFANPDRTVPAYQVGDPAQLRTVLARGGRWLLVGRPLMSWLPAWVAHKPVPQFYAEQFFGLKDLATGRFVSVRFPKVRAGKATGRSSGLASGISHDGRYVYATVFGVRPLGGPPSGVESYAGGWRYDRVTGQWSEIVHTLDADREGADAIMSGDGRWALAGIAPGGSLGRRWMIQIDTGRRLWTLPAGHAGIAFTGDSLKLVTHASANPLGAYSVWAVSTGRSLGRNVVSKAIGITTTDWSGERVAGNVSEPDGTGTPFTGQQYACEWSSGACVRISRGVGGGPAWGGNTGMFINSLTIDGTVAVLTTNPANLVAGDIAPTRERGYEGEWDVFTATVPPTVVPTTQPTPA